MNKRSKKDFDIWNIEKQRIDKTDPSNLYFYEREIWWCHVGINVGREQSGKGSNFMRPVLVLKKFSRTLCWVIPLSLQVKYGTFFFPLLAVSNIIRMACLPQLRLVDVRRLISKIDSISPLEFSLIKEKITSFMK